MVAAPLVADVAGLKVTEATPAALVNTVLALNVAKVTSVLNVTIVLGIAAPVESSKVVVTVAGVPLEMALTAVPLLLASAMDIFGTKVLAALTTE